MSRLWCAVAVLFVCCPYCCAETPVTSRSDHEHECVVLWKHCNILICWEKSKKVTFSYDAAALCVNEPVHPLMKQCLQTMVQQKSLEILEHTWRGFLSAFRGDSEEIFLKEFALVLLCLYRQALLAHADPQQKVTILEILNLSSQVASLPLDRVIDALELCYERLRVILQNYAPAPGMSLTTWIQMYWWVPPVVLLSSLYSVIARILFRQAIGNFFGAQQANAHAPRPPLDGLGGAEEEIELP